MLPAVERIEPSPGGSYCVYRFQRTSFPLLWHVHPEVELTLIESGEGWRQVGDDVGPSGPGDFVLLGSQVPHTWSAVRRRRKWCRSVVAQFREDCFELDF